MEVAFFFFFFLVGGGDMVMVIPMRISGWRGLGIYTCEARF